MTNRWTDKPKAECLLNMFEPGDIIIKLVTLTCSSIQMVIDMNLKVNLNTKSHQRILQISAKNSKLTHNFNPYLNQSVTLTLR